MKSHIAPLSSILIGSTLISLCLLRGVNAEIVTDGSVGNAGPLTGPSYAIEQQLGTTAGNNLFHSFSVFNLEQNESATFSGANSIQNIISRITGGDASIINGTIRSTIDGANMFFLNPAGMIFGAHANLDLTGSFHVSTANYLSFADGENFYVQPLDGEVLSVSSPASFGFLDNNHEGINVSGSKLYVNEGKELSLIGGAVTIDNNSDIYAPSGQVNIAAVRGESELPLDLAKQLDNTDGAIAIKDDSIIEVSNESSDLGAGSVYIRGGQLLIDNKSHIYASSDSSLDGQIISIMAENLTISEQSSIFSYTEGQGKGAEIAIDVNNTLLITEGGVIPELGTTLDVSGLISRSGGAGKAGDINIQSHDISLTNKASIDMSAFNSGNAGTININAIDSIRLVGNTRIFGDTHGLGQGGTIVIKANSLSIAESSHIDVGSFSAGDGGSINISLDGGLHLTHNSRIYSDTAKTGDGGKTFISATTLTLDGNSSIDSSSNAASFDNNTQQGVYSKEGSGHAGDISIVVSDSVILSNQSSINTTSDWNFAQNKGVAGDAGTIFISANNDIALYGNSSVNSESVNAGGGVLTLEAGNRIYLLDSVVTSSVEKGIGDGGDINSTSLNSVVLNQSSMIAQAFQGSGGNIHIKTDNFIASEESLVDASSQLGIDGTVEIEAPNIETDSSVQVLSTQYLDTRQWQQQPCATRIGEQASRFVVANRKGMPSMPDDMMPASIDGVVNQVATTNRSAESKPIFVAMAGQAYQISCDMTL